MGRSASMATIASPVRLRPMTATDIPQVSEIERLSFPTSWPPTAYARELDRGSLASYIVAVERQPPVAPEPVAGMRHRLRRALGRLSGHAAATTRHPDEQVVGYLGMWFLVDEAHIVAVAVRPESRRRGVGELLVAEALELACARGANTVTLECRVSNTPAQALYEKYGFVRAGIRKRYYTDNGEDALIMITPPLSDPAYQARLAALRRARTERYGDSRHTA